MCVVCVCVECVYEKYVYVCGKNVYVCGVCVECVFMCVVCVSGICECVWFVCGGMCVCMCEGECVFGLKPIWLLIRKSFWFAK